MFIDSDYNGKGFDRSFGEDIEYDQFIGGLFGSGSSSGGLSCPANSTLLTFVDRYGITPNWKKFKAANVPGCSSIFSMVKCMHSKMIGCYGSDSKVTGVFDTVALTKNAYNYTLQQMVDKLANVQAEVDILVPLNSNMDCLQMDNAVAALNTAQVNWNAAGVGNLYDRDLRAAYLGAIANSMSTVTSYMDVRDCTGATSAIDTSQQAAAAAAAAQAQAEAAAAAAAANAASASTQAQADAEAAALQAQAAAAAAAQQASQNIQTLKDEKQAEIDMINTQTALTKAESDKRNKMMMFGAAAIIGILVLKK